MIRYIELKSGYNDNSPAWIARVKLSKSGRTVYFGRKALLRGSYRCAYANYIDIEAREEYWISGVKKNGTDRHWAGSGFVMIERSAVVGDREPTPAEVQRRVERGEPIPGAHVPDRHMSLKLRRSDQG